MIQRKQTLFLLLAVIVCALGLFFPIGSIAPEGMGTDSMVYNLGVVTGEGGSCYLCHLHPSVCSAQRISNLIVGNGIPL